MIRMVSLLLICGLAACGGGERVDRLNRMAPVDIDQAAVGFVLYDVETGERLQAENSTDAFLPASVTKLLTAQAALEILGHDHRFSTRVLATGRLRGETWNGDIYLVGGGDPMLEAGDLMRLCLSLERRGIKRVDGRFFVDESRYPPATALQPQQPEDAAYNPGVSALSLGFNRIRVVWRAGIDGLAAHSAPPDPATRFRVGADRGFWFQRSTAKGEEWVLGPIPRSGAGWLPLQEPGAYAGRSFRSLCAMAGVDLPQLGLGEAPKRAQELARHDSAHLHDLLPEILEYSNNLAFELLGLEIGRKLTGAGQNMRQSAFALQAWASGRYTGAPWTQARLERTSGLSVENRLTPEQVAAVLRDAWKDRSPDGLLPVLPTAAWSEAFTDALRDPLLSARVWAKSGTMNFARGLAGYLFTERGRRLAFVIFRFDAEARKRYDQTRHREFGEKDLVEQQWADAARAREVGLLKIWAEAY